MINIAFMVLNISQSGGTERATINIANMLCEVPDIRVTVISLKNTHSKAAFPLSPKVHTFYLNYSFQHGIERLILYLKLFIFFRNIDQRRIFRFVIGTTHMLNSIIALAFYKTVTIGCEHIPYMKIPIFSRFLRRRCYPFLKHLVLLSPSAAQDYLFLKEGSISIIPNPLSFSTIKKSELNRKTMIAMGRLSYEKAYDRLIQVASRMKKIIPDWTIEIWGDGPELNHLKNQIVQEKVEDYVLLKGKTDQVMNQMLSASICVMTSRFEALPMILLEAQECGLPIVAYNCGKEGPCNIIRDGYNGFLVPDGDCNVFIEKIYRLVNDTELRRTMGKNSTECAKEYSCTVIREKWLRLFDQLQKKYGLLK